MNTNIWNILNPYNNDKLSSMDKKELEEFKEVLKKYLLELREELNFDRKNTFGIEIEVENVNFMELFYKYYKYYSDWEFKSDDSLIHGSEITSPILENKNATWREINCLVNDLSNCSEILSTCGAHIHIGAQIFKNNNLYYERLYKLWCAYENIIFRFGYGEYLTERNNIKYAYPLLERTINFDSIYLKTNVKCNPLNYANVTKIFDYQDYIKGNTIEVRSPNGTLNPIIWQNNINFFIKLFEYVKSDNFDEVSILKRISKLKAKYTDILDFYRLIDIEGALELADLIFDNNLDKVYFLRQYIKDDKVGTKKLEKGEKFTKCLNY